MATEIEFVIVERRAFRAKSLLAAATQPQPRQKHVANLALHARNCVFRRGL